MEGEERRNSKNTIDIVGARENNLKNIDVSFPLNNLTVITGVQFTIICVLALVAGTMFLVWLGEQITDRGIGNGMSLIIFAGIVAGLPAAIGGTFTMVQDGTLQPLFLVGLMVAVVAVTAFVIFVERGQRRLTVNYARQQRGKALRVPEVAQHFQGQGFVTWDVVGNNLIHCICRQ